MEIEHKKTQQQQHPQQQQQEQSITVTTESGWAWKLNLNSAKKLSQPSSPVSANDTSREKRNKSPNLGGVSATAIDRDREAPSNEDDKKDNSSRNYAVSENGGAVEDDLKSDFLSTTMTESALDIATLGIVTNDSSNPSPPTTPERVEGEEEEEEVECCFGRRLRRNLCCYQCLLRWPRLSAIILGVTLPLFFLILLSVVFGVSLAYAEAPLEIQQNDAILVQNSLQRVTFKTTLSITKILPTLCLRMYANNHRNVSSLGKYLRHYLLSSNNSTNESSALLFAEGAEIGSAPLFSTNSSDELFEFMEECGAATVPVVEQFFLENNMSYGSSNDNSNLTFKWIRCFPGANGFQDSARGNITEFRYNAQYDWYVTTWRGSQVDSYRKLLNNSMATNNMTESDVKAQVWNQSLYMASGGEGCELNAPASGWFWFTVLSTCGYGNQWPLTKSGRLMIYILGFFSILSFAGILASAGVTAAAIADDALVRLRLRAATHPSVACFIWGSLYYVWMLVTAAITTRWKHERMGDESFTLNSGYWFAYISSTTVGLGDIFLEPEVFLYRDLITFPICFLIGFVLVSAFFSKLGETWSSFVGKKSLSADLLTQLHTTDMLNDLPGAYTIIVQRIKDCCRKKEGGVSRAVEKPLGGRQASSAV